MALQSPTSFIRQLKTLLNEELNKEKKAEYLFAEKILLLTALRLQSTYCMKNIAWTLVRIMIAHAKFSHSEV